MDNSWLRSVPKELQSLLLEDLLQSSLVGINITDGEGRVLFLNDIHRKITGHDPQLYLGRTMKEIVEDNLISESATQIALEKKQTVFINQVSSHKNKYFQVKSVPLMNDKGEILYVLNYLLDASELIKLRDKLEKAEKNNERLITSNELLRQKLIAYLHSNFRFCKFFVNMQFFWLNLAIFWLLQNCIGLCKTARFPLKRHGSL